MPHKAIFLDRDNTVIADTCFSTDPDALAPLPGAIQALKRLAAAGWKLVIITNQSGVARGHFTEPDLVAFHAHLLDSFKRRGITFHGLYYCPHYSEGACEEYVKPCACRKPAPGLLLQAARELHLDLPRSWMIGDRPADIAAGKAASCRTIRVLTGPPPQPGDPAPDFTAPDLAAAAQYILEGND